MKQKEHFFYLDIELGKIEYLGRFASRSEACTYALHGDGDRLYSLRELADLQVSIGKAIAEMDDASR